MPNPTDVHTLRSFIGLCNYYRIYVQDFSTIAHLLYALLCYLDMEVQEAFNTLKEKLLEFPILKRPDFNKVFILHIDWSVIGNRAILGQLDEEGKEYVMHFKATTRLRATTLHTRGNALLLYGPSYISSPIFMAPISLCIPTTSLSSG